MQARNGRSWLAVASAMVAATLSGCILQEDRCGPHQTERLDHHAICVCEAGYVIASDQRACVPCGGNEEVVGNACVCKAGFTRASATAPCVPSAIGASCDGDGACPSDFPHCVVSDGAAGYCSATGCNTNAGCPQGWSCERAGELRYCRQPPSGLGAACTRNADCTGFEAQYCDTLMTHACLIAGCANREIICRNEWACCDFSTLIGMPFSVCVAPEQFVQGSCPNGGVRVSP